MGTVELRAYMHNRHKGRNKYRSTRRIALCVKTDDKWLIAEMVTGESTCRKFMLELDHLGVPCFSTEQWPSNPYKKGGYFYHAGS